MYFAALELPYRLDLPDYSLYGSFAPIFYN